jgi:hypothetical protein
MNLSKTLFMIALSAIVFSACKKEKHADPSIVGFWKGKYGGTSNYPNLGYALLFRNNGTVRVFDGVDTATAGKAEGTYTVIGSTVTLTYTYGVSNTFSAGASANGGWNFLEGTWGSGTNTTNGGRFFVNKQ